MRRHRHVAIGSFTGALHLRVGKREASAMHFGLGGLRALLAGSLFVGLLTTEAVLYSQPASAGTAVTLYVKVGGIGNCSTLTTPCGAIQTAISAAENSKYDGDNVTIVVAAGTYHEYDHISSYSLGSLSIVGADAATTIVRGTGSNSNGPLFSIGGTIVTISGLTITNGDGGVTTDGPVTLTISNSTITKNDAEGSGAPAGGIWNGSNLTIIDSTISDNTYSPPPNCEGVYEPGVAGIFNSGTLAITNSTLSGNNSTDVCGYGAVLSEGPLTVTGSTVADNGGTLGVTGGIAVEPNSYDQFPPNDIAASIVADNSEGDCIEFAGATITDEGYNIDSDGTCGLSAAKHSISDSTVIDGTLGPLRDNGGPTKTILPFTFSPADLQIPGGTILNGVRVCPRLDQRGDANSSKCTIGAVEAGFLVEFPSPWYLLVPWVTIHLLKLSAQDPGTSTKPYVTRLVWKALSLPKGLRLSSEGILSGRLESNLSPGTIKVNVQVTETVTTVSDHKKTVASTTVSAAVPFEVVPPPMSKFAWTASDIDGSHVFHSVSCPSSSFCAAVDGAGNVFISNGSTWAKKRVDSGGAIQSISCTSDEFCLAVDSTGHLLNFNGSTWSISLFSSGVVLSAVSCATTTSLCGRRRARTPVHLRWELMG
jgi:hypothetical protein